MATTAADPLFLDTSILVYAAAQSAPWHDQATRALADFQQSGTPLVVSRQVLREYLAVMSRPQFFQQPVPTRALIADIEDYNRRFEIIEDGAAVTTQLLALIEQVPCGGKQIHDANIVATMLVAGVRHLLTQNVSDFQRFSAWIDMVPLIPIT